MLDTDHVTVQRWVQRNMSGMSRTGKTGIIDAVDEACLAQSFDPLRDWAERCEQGWDGSHRVKRLFADYFVAEAQNVYSEELGQVAMMGLVLRVLYPGAQQRIVPVLQGPQEIGKSTGLAALCPCPEWFGDSLPPIGSKDAQDYVRQHFLIELAEMDVSRKSDRDELKAFLTRRNETFRKAYGRRQHLYPRRCMFWGTTNEDDYLRDPTGSTRFYPIKLKHIDVEALKRDRDQLIGEAVKLLKVTMVHNAPPWWTLSEKARAHLESAREDAQLMDPWVPDVETIVQGLDEVCTNMVLSDYVRLRNGPDEGADLCRPGLAIPKSSWSSALSRRVSAILQSLAWQKAGKMPHDSRYPRAVRFVPPKADAGEDAA